MRILGFGIMNKLYCQICGATLLGTFLTFFSVFLRAYGKPRRWTAIYIDKHGEANSELIMLLATVPAISFVVHEYISVLMKKKKAVI